MSYYLFGNCIYTNAASLKKLANVPAQAALKLNPPSGLQNGESFFVGSYSSETGGDRHVVLFHPSDVDFRIGAYLWLGDLECIKMRKLKEGQYVPVLQELELSHLA